MRITQIRNATLIIEFGGVKFLIDPMLSPRESMPGFPGTVNEHVRIPTVDLPLPLEEVLDVDAVLVTHIHTDHWDGTAAECIPADMPIFAQHSGDKAFIAQGGWVCLEGQPHPQFVPDKSFTNVRVLTGNPEISGVKLRKVPGQHGSDFAVQNAYDGLLEVCGIVFSHPDEKTLYLAGDTVWNEYVEANIAAYKPDVIILNAGDAQVPMLGNIIMNGDEVVKVCEASPHSTIVATHFEAVNHTIGTRSEFRQHMALRGLAERVLVPEDGETCVI